MWTFGGGCIFSVVAAQAGLVMLGLCSTQPLPSPPNATRQAHLVQQAQTGQVCELPAHRGAALALTWCVWSQVPWLASLPVLTWLGWPAATAWGWKINTSLGYVGQVTPASGRPH